jgi:hypothetical protein
MSTYNYPDTIGYVNNKKGFTASKYNSLAINYTLSTINCDSGKQLIIRTAQGSDKDLVLSKHIIPVLPYRLMINDATFFNKIKSSLIDSATDIAAFNPGITSSLSMPAEFDSATKFIELNVPRSCLKYFVSSQQWEMQNLGNSKYVDVTVNKIEAYDLQASMVVESNTTYDDLYIAVSSRVDMFGSYSDISISFTKPFHWFWTIPVVVRIRVNRSDLTVAGKNLSITPTAWGYPVDTAWFGESTASMDIAKINTSITGAYTSKLWNYNLIPGRYISDSRYINFRFQPMSLGCLVDIDYLSSTGVVVVANSIKNYFVDRNGYRYIHTISKFTLSSGFTAVTDYDSTVYTETTVLRISMYTANGYYVYLINNSDLTSDMIIYDSLLNIASRRIFNGTDVDLIEKSSNLYILFHSDSKRYIFKFPTISSSFAASLGTGILYNGLPAKLRTAGATQINESNIIINNNCNQDKSIVENITSNCSSVTSNLKFIGSTTLVIDKITLSKDGQINSLEFFSV